MSSPQSGNVVIGKKPMWMMMVDAEMDRRKKWDELRAKGWFSAVDVEERTGWSRASVTAWLRTHRFKHITVYNPDILRVTALYDPTTGKESGFEKRNKVRLAAAQKTV